MLSDTLLASPPGAADRTAVPGRELSIALLGLLALGGAAALGAPALGPGVRLIPSVLLVALPALALTAPALIAVHQILGLAAAPEALAAALGRALVDAGRVAGALAAVVLFFAATTGLAAPLLLISLALVGVFMTATACVELRDEELAARAQLAPAFTGLVTAWVILSWLVAVRVGVDVGAWVLELPPIGGGR